MTFAAVKTPTRHPSAPFIVWPVARREFYLSIQLALLPAILFAIIIFGWRVLAMAVCAQLAATITHTLLTRFTRRGKSLIYSHTTSSVIIMIALCDPAWSAMIITAAAALIPVMFWLIGGTGRERIHVAVVWAVLLQAGMTQFVARHHAEAEGAILARDRLVMGDIRNARERRCITGPRRRNSTATTRSASSGRRASLTTRSTKSRRSCILRAARIPPIALTCSRLPRAPRCKPPSTMFSHRGCRRLKCWWRGSCPGESAACRCRS